jgi:hypothetical protein
LKKFKWAQQTTQNIVVQCTSSQNKFHRKESRKTGKEIFDSNSHFAGQLGIRKDADNDVKMTTLISNEVGIEAEQTGDKDEPIGGTLRTVARAASVRS